MGIEAYLVAVSGEVERVLDRLLPPETEEPRELYRAMRYSVFAGGKRLRPALVSLGCEAVFSPRARALPAAAAFECVHTYSLIHDDLPAMDDDDFRRGKPSSHKAFGEALAILAGDALLTFAFELVADGFADPSVAARVTRELAIAAGPRGMVGGQVLDIRCEGKSPEKPNRDAPTLERIHRMKTASLIGGALRAGAIAGGAGERELRALTRYADALGLLFQVTDDILDVEGSSADLGKTAGKDAARGKLTYPALFGIEESRRRAGELALEARSALAGLDPSDARGLLAELVTLVRDRRK